MSTWKLLVPGYGLLNAYRSLMHNQNYKCATSILVSKSFNKSVDFKNEFSANLEFHFPKSCQPLDKGNADSGTEIDALMGWSGAFVFAGKSTVKGKAKSNPVPENVVTIDQFRYIKIHTSAARLGGNKTKEII